MTTTQQCPRCGHMSLRSWDQLDEQQRYIAERLPLSAEYSKEERKKHRFCVRCWFEIVVEAFFIT